VDAAPSRIDAVTADEVARAAREVLAPANRTIGWFDPLPTNGAIA
jgi:predicted Zn-dependent peptidase